MVRSVCVSYRQYVQTLEPAIIGVTKDPRHLRLKIGARQGAAAGLPWRRRRHLLQFQMETALIHFDRGAPLKVRSAAHCSLLSRLESMIWLVDGLNLW